MAEPITRPQRPPPNWRRGVRTTVWAACLLLMVFVGLDFLSLWDYQQSGIQQCVVAAKTCARAAVVYAIARCVDALTRG